MKPILFQIGSFYIPSYYTLISLGILLGIYFFYRYSKKSGFPTVYMLDVSIIVVATCYMGARLFHVIFESPQYYLQHPWDIFSFWKGGYVLYGGMLFPLIFIYIYAKRKKISFLNITDLLAPSVAIGTALGRMACLLQGCCFGCATNMPWGITFPEGANGGLTPSEIPLHPTQIYLMIVNFSIFLILNWRFKHKKFNGELTYWYLMLYAVGRSFVEIFRDDFRGDLFTPYMSTSQFISLIIFIIALGLLIKNYKKTNHV
ncbi:MAG: prolipoprotein diacylglyceryl transferase [Proteobacteria bacterium]|nr:prolipoprotein diacylglyceryl transferase [Pseudomonadota bacterium]